MPQDEMIKQWTEVLKAFYHILSSRAFNNYTLSQTPGPESSILLEGES